MRSRFSGQTLTHPKWSTLAFVAIGIVSSLWSATSFAASCCGGGFLSQSIITGDERATLASGFSFSNISTEVSDQGLWQNRSVPETLETFRVQGAHIFSDRFQIGGSIPFVRRTRGGGNSSGLGDATLTLGYEILPEWDYSYWRPRGVSYVTITAPSGRSIQDATDSLQLDVRGRGFWAIGIGTTLTKIISKFDFLTTFELHRSFPREISTETFAGQLVPGFGAAWSVGSGLNFNDSRVGASLGFNYEDAVETRGRLASTGAPVRFATASLTASQMFAGDWTASLMISDQTLFGAPTNTTLAKSATVTLQRRFQR